MAFPLSDEEHVSIRDRIDGQVELIVSAAIQIDGATISFARPGRHGNCINWASHHGLGRLVHECGFLTNKGRFVDRIEAGRIVAQSEQGSYGGNAENNPHGSLFSEDMWNDDDEPDHINASEIF